MRREALTEKFAEFEQKQAVGDYRWRDWRVWPVLRMRLELRLEKDSQIAPSEPEPSSPDSKLARALHWRRQRIRRFAGHVSQGGRSASRPTDLVFLSGTDRGQPLGDTRPNTIVDPWIDALRLLGRSATIWNTGEPRWPMHGAAVNIEWAWERARRRAASAAPESEPDWFDPFQQWLSDEFDADIAWSDVFRELAVVDEAATLFEGWLRRATPRALLLDCWYNRPALGAAIAAHRLGIPVVDLQHGLQGRGHIAYDGWSPAPEGGYEVFPDRFWVWGQRDADALVARNPGAIAPEDVAVTGNRWLSIWADGSDPDVEWAVEQTTRFAGGRHTILVTLQERVPYREQLEHLMRGAPADWLWLVRLHRRMHETPEQVQEVLRAATRRPVEVIAASKLPLYAWMRVANWHITGFSTCALEALPFGVPTLITHESGASAYADFIDEGVMRRHASIDESLRTLSETSAPLATVCRRISRNVFSEVSTVEPLFAELEASFPRVELEAPEIAPIAAPRRAAGRLRRGVEGLLSGRSAAAATRRLRALPQVERKAIEAERPEGSGEILARHGVCLLPGFAEVETCRSACEEIRELLSEVGTTIAISEESSGPLLDCYWQKDLSRFPDYASMAAADRPVINVRSNSASGDATDRNMIDLFGPSRSESLPTVRSLIETLRPRIEALLPSGCVLRSENVYLTAGADSPRGPHIDSLRPAIKAFTYLTDAQELGDGPYCYVPGSHRCESDVQAIVSEQKRLDWGRRATDMPVPRSQVLALTATCGDTVLSRQNGIHCGWPQEEGHSRVLLVFQWSLEEAVSARPASSASRSRRRTARQGWRRARARWRRRAARKRG